MRSLVKASWPAPKSVGVISSRADLRAALRLRSPPDFFELRLDALVTDIDKAERAIPKLPAPLIITARHPLEGGANRLRTHERRELLLRFLPYAAHVDIELRSLRGFQPVLEAAQWNQIPIIISVHDFQKTLSRNQLRAKERAALAAGAGIFKVASRTDNAAQLGRLLAFFTGEQHALPVSAMGIGNLGRASRIALARFGSVLNYAHLGKARIAGQLDLPSLRKSI
jgi:3-dehydroquinate dehydratase-1